MPRPPRPSPQRYELLHKRLERFVRLLDGVEAGDPRALHRMRVASRRLREVIPILQVDAEAADKLQRRLRKVTTRLGTVRELDVLLALTDELAGAGRYPTAALARVAATLSENRARSRARLVKKVPVRELRRLAAKLANLLTTLAMKEKSVTARGRATTARPWQYALDARVARRASVVANRMAAAGPMYLSERLHAVRIAVKKLRYALELSTDVAGLKMTPDLVQLRHAQEVLGRLHDLQVLIERTRETQASLTPPDLRAWRELDLLVVALDEDCRRLHGRYVHDAPALEALCVRLGASRSKRDTKVRGGKSAVKG